jgi:hypothetical protein
VQNVGAHHKPNIMKGKNIVLHRRAFDVAMQEAEHLRIEAVKIDNSIQDLLKKKRDISIGKMIAANVLISLSIEIYLKAFMIAGRHEGIATGHDLIALYSIFPSFLKKEIEKRYDQRGKVSNALIIEQAFVVSKELPRVPGNDPFYNADFDSFIGALTAISNKFVESRYFFEKINNNEWAIFKYYFEPAKEISRILAIVLDDYMADKFKGQA